MQISIVIVRALVHELQRRGIAANEFCGSVGLDPVALDDPTARLPFEDYNRIVEQALTITRDPQLGLYVGARTPSSALTVLGSLITSCPTLRAAGDLFLQYSPLVVEGAVWAMPVRNGVVSLSCTLPEGLVHQAYGNEVCMALVYTVIRPFATTETPLEVCFTHEPTGPLDAYRAVFDCEVHFGASETAIRGSESFLDRRQLHTDASLTELLRARADSMLADLQSPDRLPSRIRDYIATYERPSAVNAGMLAEAFGLTERTLRRRLADHKLTVRDLMDSTLREIACTALAEPNVSIKEVSFRLGFSEPSAFYRAFKRWTSLTPAEFRDGARASTAK